MKLYLVLFYALTISLSAIAQDFKYGEYNTNEMNMTKYDKDTSAHAVVLKEFGKAYISSTDGMPLIYEYHVKVKIFDSKAYQKGDVAIRLYKSDNMRFETVSDIKGTTYYKDNNGNVTHTDLDDKKVYHESVNKHNERVKFALPNIHDGCIIEYTYRVSSPYRFNFHSWDFQDDIPKIRSEFEAHIPGIYEYNVTLRGFLKLSRSNADLERECFSYYGTKCDCSKITYEMDDVPAFVEESYMTAPKNYISAIYFELAQLTNQYGVKEKITKEWKDIDYELKKLDNFGSQIKRKDLFKDRIPTNILNISDTLLKAKAIYTYLQKWFKWNNINTLWSDDGIKKSFDSHTGNSGDINLSLIAALGYAGINTEAVVLSTRDNGAINKLYPILSDFDYVVAKINVGNISYMLDATDPLLSFGLLPLRCINDQGRVMSLNKPSYWIDMVTSKKRSKTYSLDLTLQDNGKIKGTIAIYSNGYAAYEQRKEIKKFNSVDEYVQNLDEKLPKLKIIKPTIGYLDSLDLPLAETYEVEITAYNSLDKDNITFNPAFWDHLTENPFKLVERSYPIDMSSASDYRMVLTMHYPDNFEITNQPSPVGMALPNNGGKFVTGFEKGVGMFTYSQSKQLTKAIYAPEEYPYLKELYNKIIQNEKANVVFRKKP